MLYSMMSLNAFSAELNYVVKKGDSLSSILYEQSSLPIYGKNGSLKETLLLNPEIRKRHGHRIFPGESIRIVSRKNSPLALESAVDALKETHELSYPPASSNNSRNTSSVDEEQYAFLRLSPQISWLKATSSSSNQYQVSEVSVLSKASPGLLGVFGINVSDETRAYLFSYLSKVGFYSDSRYVQSKKSILRQAYGAGGEYNLDPLNRFSLRVGYFDEFYLTMNNTTTIDVEVAQVPEVHWGYRRTLGQYKNVILDSGIFGKFILPYRASSVVGKFGYGLGGDLLMMFKSKGLRFFYNYSNAKAVNKATKTFELGWNIVFESRMYD